MNARHNLDEAGLTATEWRDRWESERLFLCADGEADKAWGNETIRVHPEAGWVEIRLPNPLAHLSNTPGRAATYRLSCTIGFNHRRDEWAAQTCTGAVRYDITYQADRYRWYLDASWQTRPDQPSTLTELRQHRTVGVDLNADHLACWIINPDGNPVGPPTEIPLDLDGPTPRRDGQLRAAVTQLVDLAESNGCRSITIENLNFAEARSTGRETMGRGGRGKRFRRTVAGIPTGKFRSDTTTVTCHLAASVVIGRRGLGHRARRRTEKTVSHQRMTDGDPSSRPNTNPTSDRNPTPRKGRSHRHQSGNTNQPNPDQVADQEAQNRSGPPTKRDSLPLSV